APQASRYGRARHQVHRRTEGMRRLHQRQGPRRAGEEARQGRLRPRDLAPMSADARPIAIAIATLTVGLAGSCLSPVGPGITVGGTGLILPAPPSARVALGRALFFDARLSRNEAVSCATCHDPNLGFSDGRRVAQGNAGQPLRRHTPTLVNVGLGQRFFWDGRSHSLEDQALAVIESPDEFDTTLDVVTDKLRQDPGYMDAFAAAFSTGLTGENVLRSIADFE